MGGTACSKKLFRWDDVKGCQPKYFDFFFKCPHNTLILILHGLEYMLHWSGPGKVNQDNTEVMYQIESMLILCGWAHSQSWHRCIFHPSENFSGLFLVVLLWTLPCFNLLPTVLPLSSRKAPQSKWSFIDRPNVRNFLVQKDNGPMDRLCYVNLDRPNGRQPNGQPIIHQFGPCK